MKYQRNKIVMMKHQRQSQHPWVKTKREWLRPRQQKLFRGKIVSCVTVQAILISELQANPIREGETAETRHTSERASQVLEEAEEGERWARLRQCNQ